MVVAFFSIPYLIQILGAEKFGLLALIWAVVSYVGIFDLGLGRSLTLQVAMHDSNGAKQKLGSVIGTAYGLMLLLGSALAVLMLLFTPWIVASIKGVSDIKETSDAFSVMALSVPFIIMTSGFKGILEARQEFALVNYVRLPLGIFTFGGPALLVFWVGARLDLIACILVIGRISGCVAYLYFAFRVSLSEHRCLKWDISEVKHLCSSGGWLSVASIVSPIMGYADRFVLGALVSVNAVAYYVTPNELVTKLWIIPSALTAVLFPIFSSSFARDLKQPTIRLFDFSSLIIYVFIAPLSLILAVFSFEILNFWVGEEFAHQGQQVLVIFAFAILINCLAHVPLTLLQGTGSAKSVALLQVVEIPLFLLVLWVLTLKFGVVGAAWAWVIRALFDTGLMLKLATVTVGGSFLKRAGAVLAGLGVLLLIYYAVSSGSVTSRMLITGGVCSIFAVAVIVLFFKTAVIKWEIQR
jgi:O-antigen/teichoic acid export membrane protein